MKLMISAVVIVSLFLTACSSKDNSVEEGVQAMKATLIELQKQVDANDVGKVQEEAENLENSWAKFEEVVEDSEDLYEKVEEPLGAIQAGAKTDPLDQTTMTAMIKQLDEVLNEVDK